MKKIILIGLMSLLMLPACKNKKEVTATPEEIPTETAGIAGNTEQSVSMPNEEADEATDAVENNMIAEATDTLEAEAQHQPMSEEGEATAEPTVAKQKGEFPDNAIARIQRTPCFGRCPIYTLTVYEDGSVVYDADQWVENKGTYYGKAEEGKIRDLMERAEQINFFELKDEYDNEYVTDLPSTIITLRKDDSVKKVINRYQGPEELHKFEKYFDQLFLNLEWSQADE